MAKSQLQAENRYHAPLSEKTADELLLAIRKQHADAAECRQQLHRDGWTDAMIAVRTAPAPMHVRHSEAVTNGTPCTCGCALNHPEV
jgi:hypothetical protein